jgi:hypothetical protein
MADWILTHTDRFSCIVTHDGMFNPQSAYGDTEELWFNEWEFREPAVTVAGKARTVNKAADSAPAQPWNYFDKPAALDPFRKWSPMLSIKNAKTPTLVIHSQRDYRLDVSEGMQLFTALQRLNVPSKMLYFPDEGHWVLKPQNSQLWYETVADWCDRWTKTNAYATGYEGPAKPATMTKARAGSSDGRTGVSRPSEMGEAAPLPDTEPAPPPPAAPTTKTPKKNAAPAPIERKPPPSGPPQAEVVAPAPATMVRSAAVIASPPPSNDRAPLNRDGHRISFQIAVVSPSDEVKVGSDASVLIALRNMSDSQILFAHRPGTNNPEFSYKIEVRNAAGHLVEETAYGREAREHPQTESRTVDYLQPGMSSMQTAHLAKLVNLSRPGQYTVQVSRTDPVTHEVVKSNEVTLNVVP